MSLNNAAVTEENRPLVANSSTDEAPTVIVSPKLQIAFMVCLLFNVTFGGGMFVGVQAIYGPLESRGFCSGLCVANDNTTHTGSFVCPAQRERLAQFVNLSQTLLNALALVSGLLVDVLKTNGFFAGAVLLTVGTLLMPIDPSGCDALGVGICACCMACFLTFIAVLTWVIPTFMPTSRRALCGAVYTSFWDLGIAMCPLIGLLLENNGLDIVSVFVIVAAWPAPALVVVGVIMRSQLQSRKVAQQCPSDVATTLIAEETESFLAVVRRVVTRRRFWGLVACSTSAISYGYVVLANVGFLVQSKGASVSETHAFERDASIMMGVMGCIVGFFVGHIFDGRNWSRSARIVAILLTTMLVAIALLVEFTPSAGRAWNWKLQYLTFTIFVIWRMIAFTSINVTWLRASVENGDGAAAGTGLSIVYSIGGLIGLVVGHVATDLIHRGHFREVHLVVALCAAGLHVVQAVL